MKYFLILFLFFNSLFSAYARTCTGTRSERRMGRDCRYENVLNYLPGYNECKSSKSSSINSLEGEIKTHGQSIHSRTSAEELCKSQRSSVELLIQVSENSLKDKSSQLTSLEPFLASYDLYLKNARLRIKNLNLLQPLFLEFLPKIADTITNFLIIQQVGLEGPISDLEQQVADASELLIKIKLEAQLQMFKEISVFTDLARKQYQDQDTLTAVSHLLKDIAEGKNKDVTNLIGASAIKLVKLVVEFQANHMQNSELFHDILGEEVKHETNLLSDIEKMKAIMTNLKSESKHLEEALKGQKIQLEVKKAECSGINTEIQGLKNSINVKNEEIEKLRQGIQHCEETHTNCVWEEKHCGPSDRSHL